MRRRLWAVISMLDMQASFDRGSDMLILLTAESTEPPHHINDSDISFENGFTMRFRDEFTDMTFTCINLEIAKANRRLHQAAYNQVGSTPDWQQRQATVREVCKTVAEKYMRHLDLQIPFHQFIKAVGDAIYSTSMLLAVRPLIPLPTIMPPPMVGPDVLNLSISVLEASLNIYQENTSEATRPWRWYVWIQWHALAAALAEVCTQDDSPAVRHAWNVIDGCYPIYENLIADGRDGMLWRPIQKLHKKAQERRHTHPADQPERRLGKLQLQSSQNSPSAPITLTNKLLFPDVEMASADPGDWTAQSLAMPDTSEMDFGPPGIPSIAAWEKWEAFVQEFNGYGAVDAADYKW